MITPPSVPVPSSAFANLIEQSLAEDIGRGDQTTQALFPESVPALARILAHEPLVVAGLWLVPEIFQRLDPAVEMDCDAKEGQPVQAGAVLVQLIGDGRSLLSGERVALNFLQRLCGIATLTARFVEAAKGYKALILDTRKTTPGWRLLEKYAVRTGGGTNHRLALDSGLLIKDNHLALIGNIQEAIRCARRAVTASDGIELEVRTLHEIQMVLPVLDPAGRDILMLDNMELADIKAAVNLIQGQARVEVSGGVTLSNVREIAACGVDFISIGALTHSARAVDISMDIVAVA